MGWMMLFWVLVIVAAPTVLWFILSERRKDAGRQGDTPDRILLNRYLSGDIGLEEYERRLAMIIDAGRKGYR